MVELIREISSPSRRLILGQLLSGPKSVNEIVEATGLKQPNVSNHLAKFRMRGFLRATRQGRQVFYSIADPTAEAELKQLVEARTQGVGYVAPTPETALRYAESAVRGDEDTCTKLVDGLLRQGVPMVRVYHQVLERAMESVGRWYEDGAIDEGQEHAASAITERLMSRVVHFRGQPAASERSVVLGCCSGNWHTIGLRMVSDIMRLAGWRTHYLGASVPAHSFLRAVEEHEPRVVMIGCMGEAEVPECLSLLGQLRKLVRKTELDLLVGVGGAVVNRDPVPFLEAGGDFTAANLIVFAEEVLPRLEARLGAQNGVRPRSK